MPKRTGAPAPALKSVDSPDAAGEGPIDLGAVADRVPDTLADPPEPVVFEDEEVVPLEQEADYLTILYYGIQGSGKTTDIARILSVEPEGNLIVCNAEGGMKLLALRAQGVDTSRIRVWPKQGVRPTFDSLERLVLKVDADLAKARREGSPKPWCGFGLDSATELVKLMLDNISEDGMAGRREIERQARAAGVKPPAIRNSRARFKSERDDYGLVAGQVRSILRKLRYMDLHFLITALVRRDEDDDTGAVMYGPATPPALQQDLLGYADVVIRTEVTRDEKGVPQYVGWTRPDENHHAKDRYGVLPERLIDPTVDRVLGLIRGDVVDSDGPATVLPAADEATETADPQSAPSSDDPPAEEAPQAKPRASRRKASAARRTTTITAQVDARSGDDDDPPF